MKKVAGGTYLEVLQQQPGDCKVVLAEFGCNANWPAMQTSPVYAGRADAGSEGTGWFWRRTDDRTPSAAKLHLFQPLDGFALIGDDLRLPDQRNGHEAHGDDAEDEDEADIGLLSGKPKYTPKPGHGKGSPSTRSA